ncbi:MAG: biotin/lipoyl-binding protein [Pirellulales bacterium]
MSTEQQSIDPDLVEQTKQQIRGLVAEIAQIAKSDVGVAEFYEALLGRIVSALAAVGGAIWTVGEGGRLELAYQINLRQTGLAESEQGQLQHGRLLRKIMDSGEGTLVPPHSGSGDEEQGGNPTDFLLVLGALKSDQETQGVLEVFQRPVANVPTRRGYLRFVLQMCELAGDFLKTRRLRHFTDRQALWGQLENFTRLAHASLDPKETAYTIANEGRRLIECDRVSVALRHGNKFTVEAVSGQDVFDKRSTTVQLLNQLATAVGRTGDTVWYTGDTSNLPPQVEDAVQHYVDESHSKTVAVLPLRKPKTSPDATLDVAPAEVLGALIVEQIEDSRPKEGMLQRVDVVTAHSSAALANSLEHHGLFLMPVWKQLGKATWVVRARTLPKTIAIVVAVASAIAALVVVPADFELHGKGSLEAETRRGVFAPVQGVVEKVFVKDGQKVAKDEPLAQLSSTEIDAKLVEITNSVEAVREKLTSKQTAMLAPGLTVDRRDELLGEKVALEVERESLRQQYRLYSAEKAKLELKSPIAGLVISSDVLDELVRRPVGLGDKLMQIADPTGELELEILMPEDRMGHVAQAETARKARLAEIQKQLASSRGDRKALESEKQQLERGLQVTYILATHPGQEHAGFVREINTLAEVRGADGNVVLLRVAIDKRELTDPQLGGAATAKVYCGRRSIGYVWFHDLFAFVQRMLFRI